MFATFPSAALHGVEAYLVSVEVDLAGGLPVYQVVGLPATSVKEGAIRIRAALHNCAQDLPPRKITVNLAPADRRKDGAAFDLPIAAALAAASGGFSTDVLHGLLILGELGLNGAVRPVRGALAAAALARRLGLRGVLVPAACGAEAAAVTGVEVYAVSHLSEVLAAMDGTAPLPRWCGEAAAPALLDLAGDFEDVRGQQMARRAVEVAVAGGHNLLLYGPPGVGKTMIARRVPTILPPLVSEEAIEVTAIYSAAGLSPSGLIVRRPYRAPHHTISTAALVGGGAIPRPGEISLAHRGVLFLDELPEFSRTSIDAMRQPLEDRFVRIGRVGGHIRLPSSFLLVASANPCPCGWHGSEDRVCTCSLRTLERYRARVSGPILDRIDIQVRVGKVSLGEMRAEEPAECSAAIYARVAAARARQGDRFAGRGIHLNAEMPPQVTRKACRLTAAAERVLQRLFTRRAGFTARSVDRVLRTARTIADLDGQDDVGADAIHEASMYRALDSDPFLDPRALGGGALVSGSASPKLASGKPDARVVQTRGTT